MTVRDVTGYRYPDNWIYVHEVCADNGYGYKLGEYEQLNTDAVRTEMAEVKAGTRTAEPHHKHLQGIGDKIEEDESATPEYWLDNLMDYIAEVNAECVEDYD
jgi:hypothetical protein